MCVWLRFEIVSTWLREMSSSFQSQHRYKTLSLEASHMHKGEHNER
jgi:hypothetical protein